jgi:hypothetical protein
MIMEKKAFDVNNCVIIGGVVHALTTKAEACPDYPSHNPCEMCSLKDYCRNRENTLCGLFNASNEEFFAYVGHVLGISPEKCEIHPIDDWKIKYYSIFDIEGP